MPLGRFPCPSACLGRRPRVPLADFIGRHKRRRRRRRRSVAQQAGGDGGGGGGARVWPAHCPDKTVVGARRVTGAGVMDIVAKVMVKGTLRLL